MYSKKPDKILVVLVVGIGDLIIAVASLKALRKRFPQSKISLLVSERAYPYARYCPYVDEIVSFNILRLFPLRIVLKYWKQTVSLLLKLRKECFDLVINFYEISTWSGNLKMFLLFRFVNGKFSVGRSYDGRGLFFNLKIKEDKTKNQGDHYEEIIKSLGGNVNHQDKSDLWIAPQSRRNIEKFFHDNNVLPNNLIIGINPGSARVSKFWIPQRFAQTADFLAIRYGATIIIVGGQGEEHIASAITCCMKQTPVVCTGRFNFSETMELIKRMSLLITTHSSLMHVANAFNVPFVVLIGITNPESNGPYMPEEGKYEIVRGNFYGIENENRQTRSMSSITVEEITSAAEKLLSKR